MVAKKSKIRNVAIIGAGLQGNRRLPAILGDPRFRVTWVIDRILKKARILASRCSAQFASDWRQAVEDKTVDVVLVLTYPDSHAPISIGALYRGKDVLCEKPMTRTLKEAREVVETVRRTKRIFKCGFNHRHHPAIQEAHRLFSQGIIGKPVFGRSRYGISGRVGLEKEWRSDPNIVGGGQLMEQGIHLVDLYRWFLGDITKVTGFRYAGYWPIGPLEDNGFALLQSRDGVVASIHASLTQWTNLFEFEIYGEKGALSVEGLGGSYSMEKLTTSLHEPNKPFSHKVIEYRGGDVSWGVEWEEFARAVVKRTTPLGDAIDGLRAMEIVESVYKASKTGRMITLREL